jgi:predicted TIM-barrel fold metal-dependent hydrolase
MNQSPAPQPRRILDAHHHFWDRAAGHYPWLSEAHDFFLGDYAALRQGNRLPADYLAAAAPHTIVGTIHVEAERERSDQLGETRWLTELHAATGLPSAIVAHASFIAPDCQDVLLAHLQSPLVRGIRSKPTTAADPARMRRGQPGSMQDQAWLRGFALLEKHGLSWDLRVPYWHLAEAAEVARAFPRTAIVVNHTGLPWDRTPAGIAAWRAGLEQLAACSNVWIKISELGLPEGDWTVAGNREVVLGAIDTFGIGRCMFGSNWPVSTLRASYTHIVDGLQEILQDRNASELDAFFRGNAAAFYRVATP